MLTNEFLKNPCNRFDFENPQVDPIEIAKFLSETMLANNGIGLAANQVGLPYRVFVIKSQPIICAFNPRIVDYLGEEIYLEEGCLSFPGLTVKIKRPEGVRVRFTQPNGETITKEYHGLTARCFQHELDHLDGIIFYERATKYHKDQAFRKLKNVRKGN